MYGDRRRENRSAGGSLNNSNIPLEAMVSNVQFSVVPESGSRSDRYDVYLCER